MHDLPSSWLRAPSGLMTQPQSAAHQIRSQPHVAVHRHGGDHGGIGAAVLVAREAEAEPARRCRPAHARPTPPSPPRAPARRGRAGRAAAPADRRAGRPRRPRPARRESSRSRTRSRSPPARGPRRSQHAALDQMQPDERRSHVIERHRVARGAAAERHRRLEGGRQRRRVRHREAGERGAAAQDVTGLQISADQPTGRGIRPASSPASSRTTIAGPSGSKPNSSWRRHARAPAGPPRQGQHRRIPRRILGPAVPNVPAPGTWRSVIVSSARPVAAASTARSGNRPANASTRSAPSRAPRARGGIDRPHG